MTTHLNKRHRMTAALLGASVIVSMFFAFGILRNASSAAPATGTWTADEVKTFDGYPVLWLGDTYRGYSLTSIMREKIADDGVGKLPNGRDSFIIIYGDCTPPRGEGGCAPPLSIEVMPKCYMPEELFPSHIKTGAAFHVEGGATVREIGGSLRLWTREVGVTVFAAPEFARQAVADLQAANAPALKGAPALSAPDTTACAQIKGRARAQVDLPN